MADEERTWNLSEAQWRKCWDRARSSDALEDGACIRAEDNSGTGLPELRFYATALNKPAEWRYPFAETIPGSDRSGAFIGLARHDAATGFVHFEVILYAAAQALRADYESGAADLDYVTYETTVDRVVRGTPADEAWLANEFSRLVSLA